MLSLSYGTVVMIGENKAVQLVIESSSVAECQSELAMACVLCSLLQKICLGNKL